MRNMGVNSGKAAIKNTRSIFLFSKNQMRKVYRRRSIKINKI